MRMRRFKLPKGEGGVYHVITRTVNGAFLFEDGDKEMLRRMLWKTAEFCGVQVLTYCLLSNHFHVLVRVPLESETSDAELIRRYRILYPNETAYTRQQRGRASVADPAATIESILAQGGIEAALLRKSLHKRMGDVSEFMKTLKQRFSVWYNRTHDRYGTLWAERFKSVLIEDEPEALSTVAAYIDLNPVRAGLVEDPKDHRWCGYGEAVGEGNKRIRRGLQRVLSYPNWKSAQREYRMILFGKGTDPKKGDATAGAIPWDEAAKVLNEGGRLPAATVLRCRVRYFSDGAALGSSAFVSKALRRYQKLTGRRRRQQQPRSVGGAAEWGGLTTLRGLRSAAFG